MRTRGRAVRAAAFAAVGALGVAVNSAALWVLVSELHVNYVAGSALATQVSTTSNFALTDLVVYRDRRTGAWWRRFLPLAVMNNASLLGRLPLLALLVSRLGMDYLLANVLTLLALFVLRFTVTDQWVYRRPVPAAGRP